jgi:hypothetical protein
MLYAGMVLVAHWMFVMFPNPNVIIFLKTIGVMMASRVQMIPVSLQLEDVSTTTQPALGLLTALFV